MRTCRFGSFELDTHTRELRAGNVCTRLQQQPFVVLHTMIERPGDVVTREEFRSRLWPEGTFVDFEHSLNAAVKRLRAVLGDAADSPRFVETIPRRGYRFIASVETDAVLPLNQLTRDEQGAGGDGDRVRITVKLIDTANATQVWSATCERNACDTLAFQIEVAALHRGIAGMELPRVICV